MILDMTDVHTIREDSVHIEAVRCTGFIVSAAPHVWAELSGPGIIYHSGVGAADLIWNKQKSPNYNESSL